MGEGTLLPHSDPCTNFPKLLLPHPDPFTTFPILLMHSRVGGLQYYHSPADHAVSYFYLDLGNTSQLQVDTDKSTEPWGQPKICTEV